MLHILRTVQRRGGVNAYYRNLFIQTSSTPNPNGLKFQPAGKDVLPEEYGSSMVTCEKTPPSHSATQTCTHTHRIFET